MYKKKHISIRIIALLLVTVFLSTSIFAAEPKSSSFIKNSAVSISALSSGIVIISFEVYGAAVMSKIGCTSIVMFESTNNSDWTEAGSFYSSDYPSLTAKNAIEHADSFYFQGTAGRYYKAILTLYAGNNSGGSVEYPETDSIKAK